MKIEIKNKETFTIVAMLVTTILIGFVVGSGTTEPNPGHSVSEIDWSEPITSEAVFQDNVTAKNNLNIEGNLSVGDNLAINPSSTPMDPINALEVRGGEAYFGRNLKVMQRLGIGTETPSTALEIKAVSGQANITLYSPDGTKWNCGVDNSGSFSCS